MMRRGLRAAVLAVALVLALGCQAALAGNATEPPPAPKQAGAENAETGRRSPVRVVHDGGDLLGERLALRFKELLDASPMFRLAGPKEKAVKVLLKSRREIRERPSFGSAYTAVWLYAESEDVLAYYLEAMAGVVNEARLDAESERLSAKTDTICERYEYLFE
jgi:hypothetical protein